MTDFFRFPSTPYLLPPAGFEVREDKVLTTKERSAFLSHLLSVDEKVDGENLGISCDADGLQFQARGSHVRLGGRHFRGLETWIRPRRSRIAEALGTDLILFGEWCAVTHSVRYDALPDWFLVFDIYQHSTGRFWETSLRDEFAKDLGLHSVPFLGAGHFGEGELVNLIGKSRVGHEPMEGLVARIQDSSGALQRAKIVRSDFVQQIGQHWMSGAQSLNRITVL